MRWGRGSDQNGKGLRVYFMSSRQNFKPLGVRVFVSSYNQLFNFWAIFGSFRSSMGPQMDQMWVLLAFPNDTRYVKHT